MAKYYKVNEEDSGVITFDPDKMHVTITKDMDEADYVIDPDGQFIDMVKVRKIMGQAIDALVTTIDEGLSHYFANMPIIYTYNNCPTFQTDGVRLAANPTFFTNIYNLGASKTGPDDDVDKGIVYIAYILLHECFHAMLGHCDDPRVIELIYKGALEKDRVNYSMDAVINWMIENSAYDSELEQYIFKGVTEEIGGVLDPELSKLDWPQVYENVSDEKVMRSLDQVIFKHIDPVPEVHEEEWYRGFLDGYNEVLAQLRKDRLIESMVRVYQYPILESASINDVIGAILKDKKMTVEEKASRIYDLLGDDIDGDAEAEPDKTTGSSASNNSTATPEDEVGDKDMTDMTDYDNGKVYGTTFALYTFNCDGNPDYVKKHIFPDIELPELPEMKKRDRGTTIDISKVIDLNSFTSNLLKTGKAKII